MYVVLEAQYQSALSQAVRKINASSDKVCFEIVGYLLEELRDKNNFEAFKNDVSNANIFIGSLIFIEELAEKVGSCSRFVLPGCLRFVNCCPPQRLDLAVTIPWV